MKLVKPNTQVTDPSAVFNEYQRSTTVMRDEQLLESIANASHYSGGGGISTLMNGANNGSVYSSAATDNVNSYRYRNSNHTMNSYYKSPASLKQFPHRMNGVSHPHERLKSQSELGSTNNGYNTYGDDENETAPVPICRCRVLYLGASVPQTTKDGLQGIQEPLNHLYPNTSETNVSEMDDYANGSSSIASSSPIYNSNTNPSSSVMESCFKNGIDCWLSVWSNGFLLENATNSQHEQSMNKSGDNLKSNGKKTRFFPIESLHYCAAVRYVRVMSTTQTPHNETDDRSDYTATDQYDEIMLNSSTASSKFGRSNNTTGRFLPLDSPFAIVHQPPHSHHHPPIFAAILRRTSGIKVLECHAFVCKRETAANALVRCAFHAYADSTYLKHLETMSGHRQAQMTDGSDLSVVVNLKNGGRVKAESKNSGSESTTNYATMETTEGEEECEEDSAQSNEYDPSGGQSSSVSLLSTTCVTPTTESSSVPVAVAVNNDTSIAAVDQRMPVNNVNKGKYEKPSKPRRDSSPQDPTKEYQSSTLEMPAENSFNSFEIRKDRDDTFDEQDCPIGDQALTNGGTTSDFLMKKTPNNSPISDRESESVFNPEKSIAPDLNNNSVCMPKRIGKDSSPVSGTTPTPPHPIQIEGLKAGFMRELETHFSNKDRSQVNDDSTLVKKTNVERKSVEEFTDSNLVGREENLKPKRLSCEPESVNVMSKRLSHMNLESDDDGDDKHRENSSVMSSTDSKTQIRKNRMRRSKSREMDKPILPTVDYYDDHASSQMDETTTNERNGHSKRKSQVDEQVVRSSKNGNRTTKHEQLNRRHIERENNFTEYCEEVDEEESVSDMDETVSDSVQNVSERRMFNGIHDNMQYSTLPTHMQHYQHARYNAHPDATDRVLTQRSNNDQWSVNDYPAMLPSQPNPYALLAPHVFGHPSQPMYMMPPAIVPPHHHTLLSRKASKKLAAQMAKYRKKHLIPNVPHHPPMTALRMNVIPPTMIDPMSGQPLPSPFGDRENGMVHRPCLPGMLIQPRPDYDENYNSRSEVNNNDKNYQQQQFATIGKSNRHFGRDRRANGNDIIESVYNEDVSTLEQHLAPHRHESFVRSVTAKSGEIGGIVGEDQMCETPTVMNGYAASTDDHQTSSSNKMEHWLKRAGKDAEQSSELGGGTCNSGIYKRGHMNERAFSYSIRNEHRSRSYGSLANIGGIPSHDATPHHMTRYNTFADGINVNEPVESDNVYDIGTVVVGGERHTSEQPKMTQKSGNKGRHGANRLKKKHYSRSQNDIFRDDVSLTTDPLDSESSIIPPSSSQRRLLPHKVMNKAGSVMNNGNGISEADNVSVVDEVDSVRNHHMINMSVVGSPSGSNMPKRRTKKTRNPASYRDYHSQIWANANNPSSYSHHMGYPLVNPNSNRFSYQGTATGMIPYHHTHHSNPHAASMVGYLPHHPSAARGVFQQAKNFHASAGHNGSSSKR